MQSLYDKYGGFPTISAIVHDFYEQVLDNEILAHFFRGIDLKALVDHQTAFFCKVLGGPDNYKGRSLKGAHRGMGIDQVAFDEVTRLLVGCLEDAGVTREDVATIVGVLESVRSDIIDSEHRAEKVAAAS